MSTSNLNLFCTEYETQLRTAIKEYPQEYAWGFMQEEHIAELARLMKESFVAHTYNKKGRAVEAVCRVLGIRHTYNDINNFLDHDYYDNETHQTPMVAFDW